VTISAAEPVGPMRPIGQFHKLDQRAYETGMVSESTEIEFLIVTPTYHRESLLLRFLKQVRAQTHGRWKLLVVHDGANPLTEELVGRFGRSNTRRNAPAVLGFSSSLPRSSRRRLAAPCTSSLLLLSCTSSPSGICDRTTHQAQQSGSA
jgi:hypothetical protein